MKILNNNKNDIFGFVLKFHFICNVIWPHRGHSPRNLTVLGAEMDSLGHTVFEISRFTSEKNMFYIFWITVKFSYMCNLIWPHRDHFCNLTFCGNITKFDPENIRWEIKVSLVLWSKPFLRKFESNDSTRLNSSLNLYRAKVILKKNRP